MAHVVDMQLTNPQRVRTNVVCRQALELQMKFLTPQVPVRRPDGFAGVHGGSCSKLAT